MALINKGRGGTGMQKVDDLLANLPAKIRKTILTKAMAAGAAVVLEAVKDLAPLHTGGYRESLKVKKLKPGAREAAAGISGGNGLAYILEFGHHYKATIHGKQYEGDVAADPHFRPGTERSQDRAMDAVREYLRAHFSEALK